VESRDDKHKSWEEFYLEYQDDVGDVDEDCEEFKVVKVHDVKQYFERLMKQEQYLLIRENGGLLDRLIGNGRGAINLLTLSLNYRNLFFVKPEADVDTLNKSIDSLFNKGYTIYKVDNSRRIYPVMQDSVILEITIV
jgi:hypothetical protein